MHVYSMYVNMLRIYTNEAIADFAQTDKEVAIEKMNTCWAAHQKVIKSAEKVSSTCK